MGEAEPLVLGRDAIISSRGSNRSSTLEAPLVFAGYGLQIPEAHHDDFAGLDVRGKLVVILSGAPASIPGPLASHMQSAARASRAAQAAGGHRPWSRSQIRRTWISPGSARPWRGSCRR